MSAPRVRWAASPLLDSLVDVWFRRAGDKTGSLDGWQAVDATPQETSGGSYQMGPASLTRVKALGQQLEAHTWDTNCDKSKRIWVCERKEGAIAAAAKDYDETFVMAEVNSDKRYFQVTYNAAGVAIKKKHIMTEVSLRGEGRRNRCERVE